MQKQMSFLQDKVDKMQQQHQQQSGTVGQEAEEDEDVSGNLVELSEMTKSFLRQLSLQPSPIQTEKAVRPDWNSGVRCY